MLAGVGYNVVNYCCQICASEGIEEVASSTCNDVHKLLYSETKHTESEDMACTDTNHQPSGCHLLRLSIDTPSLQVADNNLIEPYTTIDSYYLTLNFISDQQSVLLQNCIHPPDTAFHYSGREITTLHAVFLI